MIKIAGVGKYLPKRILTNFDLEKMVDTSNEWIITRTGVLQRRIAEKGIGSSSLAIRAARKALKSAGLKPKDVELIIVATITPDMQFPSTSCLVQAALGANRAACFDVSAACSGFIYGLTVAEQFIAAGKFKNVLVIGAEVLSSIVDWKDRSTCILFGDGAGACVLVPAGRKKEGIISTYLGSDGNSANLLTLPAGGSLLPADTRTIENKLHFIKMQGNELFKVAVRVMVHSVRKVIKMSGLEIADVHHLIPHQANIRIIEAAIKRLGIQKEKVCITISKYGNMSSASVAVALCEAVESERIKKGDIVVLVAFGSGLSWGANVIRW